MRQFKDNIEYDKAWYKLVEEIVDLDDQLTLEQISGDEDAHVGISFLEQQLEHKRNLLKQLDTEGIIFINRLESH